MKDALNRLRLHAENLQKLIGEVARQLNPQVIEAERALAVLRDLQVPDGRDWNTLRLSQRFRELDLRHKKLAAKGEVEKAKNRIHLTGLINELTKYDIVNLFSPDVAPEQQVKEAVVNYLVLAYRLTYLLDRVGLASIMTIDPFIVDVTGLSASSSLALQAALSYLNSEKERLRESILQFIQNQLQYLQSFNAILERKMHQMLKLGTAEDKLAYLISESIEFYDAVERNNFIREMSLAITEPALCPKILAHKEKKFVVSGFVDHALFPIEPFVEDILARVLGSGSAINRDDFKRRLLSYLQLFPLQAIHASPLTDQLLPRVTLTQGGYLHLNAEGLDTDLTNMLGIALYSSRRSYSDNISYISSRSSANLLAERTVSVALQPVTASSPDVQLTSTAAALQSVIVPPPHLQFVGAQATAELMIVYVPEHPSEEKNNMGVTPRPR